MKKPLDIKQNFELFLHMLLKFEIIWTRIDQIKLFFFWNTLYISNLKWFETFF